MIHKKLLVFVMYVATVVLAVFLFLWFSKEEKKELINVGILYSLTGSAAQNEHHLVDAIQMAIDEINAKGGVLGRQINPIVVDGKSNVKMFEEGARDLIDNHKVVVIFGCWTSEDRKAVKPIVEQANSLLFYPVQYEGLEESNNIIYTGGAPNQTIIPGITWAFQNLGKKFYIVGSDYVYPRAAHAIMVSQAAFLGAEIVGSNFIELDSKDVDTAIEEIVALKPDVILNVINGFTNNVFFAQLRAAGITPEKIPTISFRLAEPELDLFPGELMAGDYAVWNYFQSIDREENRIFIENYQKRFGKDAATSNNIESSYDNVYLWALAVNQAKTTEVGTLLPYIKKQVFNGPGSIIYLAENNHAWREVFVGKIRYDTQFDIIWSAKKAMHPEPYPPYTSKKEWEDFLTQLYVNWGNQWAKHTR